MNEAGIHADTQRHKEIFRREQALSFAEKVRIAFDLKKRRDALKQARLIERKDTGLPPSTDGAE